MDEKIIDFIRMFCEFFFMDYATRQHMIIMIHYYAKLLEVSFDQIKIKAKHLFGSMTFLIHTESRMHYQLHVT